jgi:localization factor PodJL
MMASGANTMKPGVPWSVKGIQPKARETAKDAARQAGLTLGEWLNQTILEQERERERVERADRARKGPARKPVRRNTGVDARLDEMSRKLDQLAGSFVPAAGEEPEEPEPNYAALPVEGLVEHIVRTEQRTDTAIDALRQDLNRISDRLESQPAVDSGGLVALEQTLSDVVDHIELTDRRNSEVLRTVQSRLSDLSLRIPAGEDGDTREAIEQIEDRLASIVARLDDQGGAREDRAYEALERKLSDLARRVATAQDAVSSNPAVSSLEARVNQLTDKLSVAERLMPAKTDVDALKTRLSELQGEVSRIQSPARPAVLQAIESRMNTLAGEIDMVRKDAVSTSHFDKVAQRLDEMNARLRTAEKGLGDSVPRTAVDERLEEMQRRLKSAEQGIGNAPSINAVEARFQEMQERLRRAEMGLGKSADGKSVEARFQEMQDRLRAAEQGLGNLPDTGTLEARLGELSRRLDQSLDGSGAGAPEVGFLSARVEELARRVDEGGGGAIDGSALRELEAQISRLGDRLDQSEQRFGAPLQSIEANLSQLYEGLETSRNASVQAAEHAAVQAAQKILAEQSGIGAGDAIAALERSLADVKTQASNADRRTQDTLEAVHDTLKRVIDRLAALEERGFAGAGAKAGADGDEDADFESFRLPPLPEVPPFARTATGDDDAGPRPPFADAPAGTRPTMDEDESNFASAYDAEPGQRTRNEDFIAAARRAAQAASRESVAGDDEDGEKPAKSGFLSFGRNRKRTLLYAAAALFLAAGALSMSGLVGGKGGSKLATPVNTGSVAETADTMRTGGETTARAFSYVPDTSGTSGTVEPVPLAAEMPPTLTLEAVNPANVAPRFAPVTAAKSAAGQFAPPTPGAGTPAKPSETKLAPTGKGAPTGALAALGDDAASPAPEAPAGAAAITLELPPEAIGSEALRTAAAGGDPMAQFEVASRFAEGKGVAADDARASVWYQRAAAQGHAPSQYRLGTLYEKGRGVDKDLNIARSWYERAAERGNRKAMHNLAVLLANSNLGQPDFTRAARWFLKAAEYGLADSQFNIAILHERGLGVEADKVAAYKWLRIAAAAGDGDAGKRADDIEGGLDAATLARARAEIGAWRPKTPDPTANTLTADTGNWDDAATEPAGDRVLVSRAQLLLAELGYDPGPVDGYVGPKTRKAIETFESERGLAVSGIPTVGLIRAMEEARG